MRLPMLSSHPISLMLHDDKLQMTHLVLLVSTTPAVTTALAITAIAAVAAGLGPPFLSADGNVDPPVASNINLCPPMADLAADVDAVPVN